MEDTGLALTVGAFRMGYFYGGDGQSQMKYDLRNAAGFIRDAAATVTNFLLPIKVRQGQGRGRSWPISFHFLLPLDFPASHVVPEKWVVGRP